MPPPATGTLSYNGVTFDSIVRSSIKSTPVPDDARRTVKCVRHEIEVSGFVTAGGQISTDNTFASWRRALTTNGGELRYDDKGFGTLIVNGAGGARDAEYGPWVQLLSFDPIGHDQAARVHWRCVTAIPECAGARYTNAFMMLNYSVSWHIDNEGLTTRKVTGVLEIPATRIGGARNIPDNADAYRDQIKVPRIDGYTRDQDYDLSPDKRTLRFTVTDREQPIPLPQHMTRAQMEHSISWSRQRNMRKFIGRLSGTLSVVPGRPKSELLSQFLLLLHDRLTAARAAVGSLPHTSDGKAGGSVWIKSLDIRDNMFGLDAYFDATYETIGLPLRSILAGSGLWRPIPGTNFTLWSNSVDATVLHERGAARQQFLNAMDRISDLCEPPSAPGLHRAAGPAAPPSIQAAPPSELTAPVAPDNSWESYECYLVMDEDDRIARHKPLGWINSSSSPSASLGQSMVTAPNKLLISAPDTGSKLIRDIIQEPVTSSFRMWLIGQATRLAYDIPTPRLVGMENAAVTQARQRIVTGVRGAVGDLPINWKAWVIEYVVAGIPPAKLPYPANLALDVKGA